VYIIVVHTSLWPKSSCTVLMSLSVQDHDRVERLALCGRRDLALHGQMGEKRFHLGRPHLRGMPLPMETG